MRDEPNVIVGKIRSELRLLPPAFADRVMEIVEGVLDNPGLGAGPGLLRARMASERLAAFLESQRFSVERYEKVLQQVHRKVLSTLELLEVDAYRDVINAGDVAESIDKLLHDSEPQLVREGHLDPRGPVADEAPSHPPLPTGTESAPGVGERAVSGTAGLSTSSGEPERPAADQVKDAVAEENGILARYPENW